MGAFLDKPNTEKKSADGQGNGLKYGLSAMQGWRVEMEDAHCAVTGLGGYWFLLFVINFSDSLKFLLFQFFSTNLLLLLMTTLCVFIYIKTNYMQMRFFIPIELNIYEIFIV